jgi:purine-nucleoside/S-methyl-5'-thioadenosine phosphorylase / adenosine deaminase
MMFDMSNLPQPSEAFDWVQAAAGPALVCRPLAAVAPHIFTTRRWPLGSMTPGGEDPAPWHDVARAMHVSAAQLVRVHQVHGAAVVIAEDARDRYPEADIVVSRDPTLALAVQAADCIPLLLADPSTGAVAAAHAGWRGLAAAVPSAAVESLAREFGSRSSDLLAAIGPAIGACCYEVGSEVRDRFEAAGATDKELARWFLQAPMHSAANPSMSSVSGPRRRDRWFFDGWTAARDQLAEAGVPGAQIFVAGLCTASHPDVLCSYRRDGSPAGRIAGAIRRRPLDP